MTAPLPAPHDLAAEATVLRSVMAHRDGMSLVADVVRPEDFYSDAHRWVFQAAHDLWSRSARVNPISIIGRLKDLGRLASVTPELVHEIATGPGVSSTLDARAIAQRVRHLAADRALLWDIEAAAARLRAGVAERGPFLDELSGAVLRAAETAEQDDSVPFPKAVAKVYKALQTPDATRLGIPFGLAAIDGLLGGLRPGELTILAARPGMAKSALALAIALNVAATGAGVVFYTLEMTDEEVAARAIASRAAVNMRHAKKHGPSAEGWKDITQHAQALCMLSNLIVDPRSLTIPTLRSRVVREATRFKAANKSLGLIVLDYFQLISGTGKDVSENDRLERAINATKRLAVEMRVPVLALSQLSRDVEKRGGRPRPSDLRGSGGLEQAANNILFIHRGQRDAKDEYGNELERELVEVIVAKQRDGDTGTALVAFERQFTKFSDAEPLETQEYWRKGVTE